MANSATKNISSSNTGTRPQKTAVRLSQPTVQDIINYGNNSLASSISKWNQRSAAGTGWGTTPERKLLQNLTGKTGECIWYCVYINRFSDLDMPDLTVYPVGQKNYNEDMSSLIGNFTVGVKTKELFDANRWGASWSFQDTDDKVFPASSVQPNQYISMVVADLNVINGDTSKPKALMNEVTGRVYACVKTQWLHAHNLFAPDDHLHKGKLVVRYSNSFTDPRDGKTYDSMLDIVNKHYNGNMDILWQL